MKSVRSKVAFTLISLATVMVLASVVLFTGYRVLDNTRQLIESSVQSSFASLSNYLRRGFDPQDPRLVQAYLQNYVYNHPYLKSIWLISSKDGLALSDQPWTSAPQASQMAQLDHMDRDWKLDWRQRGIWKRVRYFDPRDDRFHYLTLAFVFDRGYLQGVYHAQALRIILVVSSILVILLLMYQLVKRFWVRPLERMTAELKQINPQQEKQFSTHYPIAETVFLARQFNRAFKQQRQLLDSLAERSIRDSLTGLFNRAGILEHLEKLLQSDSQQIPSLAVIFVDLDGFKNVNDLYGHEVGDRLLQQVAETLREMMPEDALIGRLGGDEFLVLYPLQGDTHQADLHLRLSRLLEALQTQVRIPGERMAHVSASIGVAIFPQDGKTSAELLQAADVAMFHAKAQGRNTYRLFDPALFAKMEREVRIGNDIEMCLEQGHFYLVYQPKVDAVSGKVYGFEALARLNHPVLGPISPAEFIPIVENSIYSRQFGEWVMKTALSFLAEFKEERPQLSINVQKRQLDKSFLQKIVETCRRLQISPHLLTLELLESDFFADLQGDNAIYTLVDEHGIRLSIDDFGTGFSSLSYLEKLRVDELKVDRSFVNHIKDDNPPYVLEAIWRMAEALHLDVVVEGVETAEQLRVLRRIGYRHFQGFYFSKPLSAREAHALDFHCRTLSS